MTALAIETTVDAYPLGRPPCGTLRYGMTPEQAMLYRWLVKNRPHDKAFAIGFREAAIAHLTGVCRVHDRVMALVERGWLKRVAKRYTFIEPIQFYAERRNAA